MSSLNIEQVNKVNREMNIPTLNRHASEENDIRIEGKGESLRLPFLPTLKFLLFQSKENLSFFIDRVNKSNELGLAVDDFDSPIAIFNFLVPSYSLKFKGAKLLKEPYKLEDYDKTLIPTDENPAFQLIYSAYSSHRNGTMLLKILIQKECCYMELVSGRDGSAIADSFLKMSYEPKNLA
jgi:hypothetical protein